MYKKVLLLILSITIFICCISCSNEQDDVYNKYVSSTSSDTQSSIETSSTANALEGNLKIAFPLKMDNIGIYPLVKMFQKEYPNVEIELEYPDYSSDAMDFETTAAEKNTFMTRLFTEISGGNSPDLLFDLAGGMNVVNQTRSGILVDLNEYIQNDPDFEMEDYFGNIIKSMEINGKLTRFPFSIIFETIYFNSAITDQMDGFDDDKNSYNYAEILELYDTAISQGIITEEDTSLTWRDMGKDIFTGYEIGGYVDLDNNTSSFTSPGFIEYLERTNAIPTEKTSLNDLTYTNGIEYFDEFIEYKMFGGSKEKLPDNGITMDLEKDKNALFTSSASSALMARELLVEYKNLSSPIFIESIHGVRQYEVSDEFMIPATAENKDIAWEFIKFCIKNRDSVTDEETHYIYADGNWSINKHNSLKLVEAGEEMAREDAKLGVYPGQYTEMVPKEVFDEAVAFYFDHDDYSDSSLYSFLDINEPLENYYYKSLLTAEDCAKTITDKVQILLQE